MADASKARILQLSPNVVIQGIVGSFYIERVVRSSTNVEFVTPACRVSFDPETCTRIDIGEGGTIANECAILGTPNILINPISKTVGVHQLLKSKGLQEYFDDFNVAFPKIYELLDNIDNIKKNMTQKAMNFIDETVDVTDYIIQTVERVFNNLRNK
jgi:hypothetical protein